MKYQPFWLYLLCPHPTEHIQMRGTTSEMRCAYTKILIVTRYPLLQGLEMPLCLRCAFVLPSLQVRSHRWSINGLTTDLERNYNGATSEGVEVFAKSHWSLYWFVGDGFGMVFTFYIVFQAYRIRLFSQKLMLIVMLLRLSAAHNMPSSLYITSALSVI